MLSQVHLVFSQSLCLSDEAAQLVLPVAQLGLGGCSRHASSGLGPVNGRGNEPSDLLELSHQVLVGLQHWS